MPIQMIKKIIVLLVVLMVPSIVIGKASYVEYSTFEKWLKLTPEFQSLEVCGLTETAHNLWADQQLKIPESTFMRGDFSETGRRDWIIQLHQPASQRPCDNVLIVSYDQGVWQRLFFEEIRPGQNESWVPLWNSERNAIGIDINQHRRRSRPAQL